MAKPVERPYKALTKTIKEAMQDKPVVDFSNTEIAFADKSDFELKRTARLFQLMNKSWVVGWGTQLGAWAVKWRLPLSETITKKTIFKQFCGGTTLLDSQPVIQRLWDNKVLSILDYGAEGKETEEEFNKTMNENIRAIEFAAQNGNVPVISTKITGLARFSLLEKKQSDENLPEKEQKEFQNVLKRIDSICHTAYTKGVAVFIDAEESWIQESIDDLADLMMARYNKKKVVVYNTFQMYRNDRLDFLKVSFDKAKSGGYLLGAKLVRGAYMEKERERAEEMGYPSPIQPTKEATDLNYNEGIKFCVENYEKIASCNASHNNESALLQAKMIVEKKIQKDHPHLNFCQLLGMSDHLTFNLAKEGFNVAKYVVYGSVREIVPYLVRRAQENTSVTGEMGRELELIMKEVKRRGL